MGRAITMTDSELLEASRRGEHAAFGALVERYQDVVCAVSYSRTRDQALSEDVAQDTFLAAWRQLDQLREPTRLRSWLCGIAKNLARKARRKTDRETPIEEPELVARDNPFDAVSEAQAERVVGEALARVPETYRDVLVLYYREQRSAKDVAEALAISESAVLQRLARGRKYLADGVTALVEKSLRTRRPRRDLAAAVVAALPFAVPSRVEAATHATRSTGGTMLKIALATALFGAAGTTAYVVHDARSSAPEPAPAPAAVAIAAPTPDPAPGPTAAAPTPTLEPGAAPLPPDQRPANEFGDAPVDAATIERLGLEDGPSRGPDNAPVTIVVFTDLLCTFCGKALGSLDQLVDEYPNKLRLVVKQMPVHEKSKLPAEAALAAEAQGKFWELHDLMLAHQDDLSREALLELAAQAKLDVAKLRVALDTHEYTAAVKADLDAAKELELNGAPSLVINGRRIVGMRPMEELRAMVDAALEDRR